MRDLIRLRPAMPTALLIGVVSPFPSSFRRRRFAVRRFVDQPVEAVPSSTFGGDTRRSTDQNRPNTVFYLGDRRQTEEFSLRQPARGSSLLPQDLERPKDASDARV